MPLEELVLATTPVDLTIPVRESSVGFTALTDPSVKEAKLLHQHPWVRTLGRLDLTVSTEGWKFPSPPAELAAIRPPRKLLSLFFLVFWPYSHLI